MVEYIDTPGEARILPTLDAYAGDWGMDINPNDRDKTTFEIRSGTYQCLRIPFGLTNESTSF